MAGKIDPWGSGAITDYEQKMKEFGISNFEGFAKKLPDPPVFMRRGIVFGHRDFEKIYSCIKNKKPFVMLTGLMPSGKFHLGHTMVAQQFIYYQSLGAKCYIVVADIEAHHVRNKNLDELRKTAIEEYLLNYIALGLKPKNCDFYFQSSRSSDSEKSNAYYRFVAMAFNRATFSEFKAVYGDISPGKMISVVIQVADILHPMLPEFDGKIPVVVPVGLDQDPHLRLTRDIASRLIGNKEYNLLLPSSTYHKFMPGLRGGKMSSSDPNSYIALTDNPKQIKEKIMKHAFSGGRGSVEEHRKYGGNPDVDVSYQMLYYMFEPNDKKINRIYDDYKSGKLLTGELKQYLIEKLIKFLTNHQNKREKARNKVDRFLG